MHVHKINHTIFKNQFKLIYKSVQSEAMCGVNVSVVTNLTVISFLKWILLNYQQQHYTFRNAVIYTDSTDDRLFIDIFKMAMNHNLPVLIPGVHEKEHFLTIHTRNEKYLNILLLHFKGHNETANGIALINKKLRNQDLTIVIINFTDGQNVTEQINIIKSFGINRKTFYFIENRIIIAHPTLREKIQYQTQNISYVRMVDTRVTTGKNIVCPSQLWRNDSNCHIKIFFKHSSPTNFPIPSNKGDFYFYTGIDGIMSATVLEHLNLTNESKFVSDVLNDSPDFYSWMIVNRSNFNEEKYRTINRHRGIITKNIIDDFNYT